MPTDLVRGLKAHGTSPAKTKLFRRFPLLLGCKIFPGEGLPARAAIQRMATLTGAGGTTEHSIFFLWSAAHAPCASCGEKLSRRAR